MKKFKLLLAVLLVGCAASSVPADSWKNTGPLNTARSLHTATLLTNGMVLVAGGLSGASTNSYPTNSAELYDPASGTWTNTGSMNYARYEHTATLLPNGQVLVAGGLNGGALSSCELYDPASGTWTNTGSMNYPRNFHTATSLTNGLVLVAGGDGTNGVVGYLASCELYDPASGSWAMTGSMSYTRYRHTATLLTNGMVLVAGGYGLSSYPSRSELYNPVGGTWKLGVTTGIMRTACESHTATLLPNGEVLVVGGVNGGSPLSVSEVYDPPSDLWANTGSLKIGRYLHTATLLTNGKVLVAGGIHLGFPVYGTNSAELYDSASGTWANTASLNTGRYAQTATLLPNGDVLVAGGSANSGSLSSAELYNVSSVLPPLGISLSNSTVTVWWQNGSGWTLQQNGDLTDTNGWSASSGVTNISGTNYLNLTNTTDRLFFRLH